VVISETFGFGNAGPNLPLSSGHEDLSNVVCVPIFYFSELLFISFLPFLIRARIEFSVELVWL